MEREFLCGQRVDERFRTVERLRKRTEIRNVLRRRGISGMYCILYAQRSEGPRSRLGVIVTLAVGGAVARNRAKRRVREVFRRVLKNRLKEKIDMVIRVKPEIGKAAYSEIADDLIRTTQRGHWLADLDDKRDS